MAASSVIGALRVNLGLDSAQFSRGAGRAQTSMGRLQRSVQNASRYIARAGRTMALSFAAIGAAAIGGAVAGSRQLQDLSNQARLAGVSAQEFKVLSLASREFGIEQDKLADILKDVNDKFGDYAATGAGPLKDFFENIAPQVGLTQEAFAGLSSSEALQLYVSSLEKANVSQAQMTFYMEALASDATALIPLFRDNGAAIDEMAEKAAELGLTLNDDVIQAAAKSRSEFGIVADVLRTRLAAAFVELMPEITELAEAAIPALIAAMDAIKPIIRGLADLLAGDFRAAWDDVRPIVQAASDGMIAVLSDLGKLAAQKIREFGDYILAELKAIPARVVEQARQIGRDIVDGLRDGILGGREELSEASKAMAEGGISAARDALQIRSPSRVFMQIGRFVSQGMAEGITSDAEIVKAAAMDLSNAAISATSDLPLNDFSADLAQNISQIERMSDLWGAVKNSAIDALRSIAQESLQVGLSGIGSLISGAFGGGGVGPATAAIAEMIPSFEGGGFTGSGPRTGGVDGRGGFHAILHPGETVTDHSRGGMGLNVNVSVDGDGNLRAMVRNEAGQMIAQSQASFQNDVIGAVRGAQKRRQL